MLKPILVINAGSSSIKFAVFETTSDGANSGRIHGEATVIGACPHIEIFDSRGRKLAHQRVTAGDHESAIATVLKWFEAKFGSEAVFHGVGHRVVHGGAKYSGPVLMDAEVLAELESLVPLAPLHQPHNIAAIRAIEAAAPHVKQVVCFDTAFHITQPRVAREFALPRELSSKGIRRYGFHGLSYEYITSTLPEILPFGANGKVIVAHLGNGASMCAIDRGSSIATTMGFTALDGLPMGTRSGAIDPGVILYLLQHEQMDARAIETLLYERSGLLGMSGLSSDMKTLLASDSAAARDAVDLFVYRVSRELGSLVAALGGLDAFIFTGGIGEHAIEIRARVCRDARWIGITLDDSLNAKNGPCISTADSAVSAWVIPTDENLVIAGHTRRLIDGT